MVFNDPWYHDDSHEIYNSAPERGYINGEDPLESRFLYTVPLFVTLCLVAVVGTLYGFVDPEITPSEAGLHNEKVARDYVFDQLSEKNRILNSLRARETELLNATSEWYDPDESIMNEDVGWLILILMENYFTFTRLLGLRDSEGSNLPLFKDARVKRYSSVSRLLELL